MKAKLLKRARKEHSWRFRIHHRNGVVYFYIFDTDEFCPGWREIDKKEWRDRYCKSVIKAAERIFGDRKWKKPRH
jgi:hypothetical protein